MSTKAIAAISGIIGFGIGCGVMALLGGRHDAGTKASAGAAAIATKAAASAKSKRADANAGAEQGAQAQAPSDGAATRRTLNEIKRKNLAPVYVRFFGSGVKLSPQFCELFDVTSDEANQLNRILQSASDQLWADLKSQAQVTRTETGDILIKFPPSSLGPDLYDKVMDGFQNILGIDRFKDVAAFNNYQIEHHFDEFGAQVLTVTLTKTDDSSNGEPLYGYKIQAGGVSEGGMLTLKRFQQYHPEWADLIPTD